MNVETGRLDRLATLTQRYARYSLSAGGLSSIFGGALCIATFLIGALAPLAPAMRIVLAAAPFLWLAAKTLLRRRYYQRDGEVIERLDRRAVVRHRAMAIYLLVVAVVVLVGFIDRHGAAAFEWPKLAYLLLVAALPIASWIWFYSVADFLIGTWLFCQAAVVIAGGYYPLAPWIFFAPVAGIAAIAAGFVEHRDYLGLRRELHGEVAGA